MDTESPVIFEMKEEPASPLWDLELLDEVGGIWEGDVGVIEAVDEDVFWGQQDISELIGKEEQILGLELDEIVLEDDDELKEGSLESFYPPDDNSTRFGTSVIGSVYATYSVATPAQLGTIVACESFNDSTPEGTTKLGECVTLEIDSLTNASVSEFVSPNAFVTVAAPDCELISNVWRQCFATLDEIGAPEIVSLNGTTFEIPEAFDASAAQGIDPFNNATFEVSANDEIYASEDTLCADITVEAPCSDALCTNLACQESVCTDISCPENVCTDVGCTAVVFANPHQTVTFADGFSNGVQSVEATIADYVFPNLPSANELVSQTDEYSLSSTETFSWLDSGAIYDGPNSTVSGLPTYSSPGIWSGPESPTDEKPTVFVAGGAPVGTDPLHSAPAADLLKEFEDVLSQAAGSLTPPDSPRSANGNNVLLQLPSNHLQPLTMSPATSQGFIMLQDMANSPAVNDDLDELMAETYQKNGGTNVNTSGDLVKNIKASRPWDSPSASSSACSDSGYEDPDWSPAKSTESSGSTDTPPQTKKLRLTSTEERRLRKKEQNKNAATRYRMKKKMEMEEIIGEEKELLDRHEMLKSDVVEITREIKYLKGLMGDLFRAKGLIRAK